MASRALRPRFFFGAGPENGDAAKPRSRFTSFERYVECRLRPRSFESRFLGTGFLDILENSRDDQRGCKGKASVPPASKRQHETENEEEEIVDIEVQAER